MAAVSKIIKPVEVSVSVTEDDLLRLTSACECPFTLIHTITAALRRAKALNRMGEVRAWFRGDELVGRKVNEHMLRVVDLVENTANELEKI